MPRRSINEREVELTLVPGTPRHLVPPATFTEEEVELWRACVESKPGGWFGPDTMPLLTEYIRAVSTAGHLDAEVRGALESDEPAPVGVVDTLLRMRDRESRRAIMLATKLRLTQQSRYTPQAAGTADRRAAGKRPWHRGPGDSA